MAGTRVAPLKSTSIPRLGLTAANLTGNIAVQLREELYAEIDEKVFWIDSKLVLWYTQSTMKQFKIFFAKCIHQIKRTSDVL